jgi:hypothetical protein
VGTAKKGGGLSLFNSVFMFQKRGFFALFFFIYCLMGVYSSIWNVDDWATQGGRVKTDWTHAPFVTTYERFERGDGKDLLGSSFPLMSASAKLQTCCEETRI